MPVSILGCYSTLAAQYSEKDRHHSGLLTGFHFHCLPMRSKLTLSLRMQMTMDYNIHWKEVPSFYKQHPNAQVFVTREYENNITHVQFGDGINGARLPSGVNNVVATYRYGSGADSPNAGQLTVLTQAWPNLKAIRNPVTVGGGADPDSAKQIRQYAPQSVLTFGRAVSADDYETIAAQAPGVARARAYYTWNADQQRSLVTIYVGDT